MKNRTPKVLTYKGNYIYDVVNRFVDELNQGFVSCGKEFRCVDLRDRKADINTHLASLKESCPFIVSFNAIRTSLEVNGQSVYHLLNCPFVAVLIDHPLYHYDILNHPNTIATVYDSSHKEFLEKIHPDLQIELLYHAGLKADAPEKENREIDILFPGSFHDPVQSRQKVLALYDDLKAPVLRAIEVMLSSDHTPVHEAMRIAAAEIGVDLYEPRHPIASKLINCLRIVDIFHRSHKRVEDLSILDQAGIPVTIMGINWPSGLFKNHRILPPSNIADTLKMIANSKILLNVDHFPNGSHERVFSGMLNGSAVVSNFNPFYQSLGEDQTITLYKPTKEEELPAKVSALLNDENRRREITDKAKILASTKHTWTNRASELFRIVEKSSPAIP